MDAKNKSKKLLPAAPSRKGRPFLRVKRELPNKRCLAFELLEDRCLLAVQAVGVQAFADDPVIDFNGISGPFQITPRTISEQGVTLIFEDVTYPFSEALVPPSFDGAWIMARDLISDGPMTVNLTFESPINRLGFDFGVFSYYTGSLEIRLLGDSGNVIDTLSFTPNSTAAFDFNSPGFFYFGELSLSYGFAGVESTEPFTSAVISSTLLEQDLDALEFQDLLVYDLAFIIDNIYFNGTSEVTQFTNATNIEQLAVDFSGPSPDVIAFYSSDDGVFDSGDTELSRYDLSQSSIDSSELLVELTSNSGGSRLTLNPAGSDGVALKSALENKDVNIILAVANPDGNSPSAVSFRGFYSELNSPFAVVRTGSGTEDSVSIANGTLSFVAGNVLSTSTPVNGLNSVLVVTAGLDDNINVESNVFANLTVMAGSGNDVLQSGRGDDELNGGFGDDRYQFLNSSRGRNDVIDIDGEDWLDFDKYTTSGVRLDINLDTVQEVSPTLELKLSTSDTIENVVGTELNDIIFGNDQNNRLNAGKGNDVVFGQGNTGLLMDFLDGGEGDDVLFGDGFTLSASQKLSLGSGLSAMFDGSNTLNLLFGLNPISGGMDTIVGGDGNDFIVGGRGKDIIDAGTGNSLIFGDTFSTSASLNIDFTELWSSPDAIVNFLANGVTLVGDGEETITGGDGSNVILGGGGNDTIEGGDTVGQFDFLFGNDGNDTIKGYGGFNLIVGGNGDDPLLEGGPDTDVILGDDLDFSTASFNFANLTSFVPNSVAGAIQKFAKLLKPSSGGASTENFFGLKLTGSGEDTINTGGGVNLVAGGGGDDMIKGGTGLIDVLYGNAGDDNIEGKAGVDFIVGGDGNDYIWGGADGSPDNFANVLFGDNIEVTGASFDLTELFDGTPSMPGVSIELSGDGRDYIYGGDAFDLIVGGNGADTLWGNNGTNIAFGDDFGIVGTLFDFASKLIDPFDTVVGAAAKLAVETAIGFVEDFFLGANGTDPFENADEYYGGTGNDYVFGGDGSDYIEGDPLGSTIKSFDFLVGGFGDDDILLPGVGGTTVAGVAWGGPGDDTITGGDGNDILGSTIGNDTFFGNLGNDAIFGGDGGDKFFGGDGDDYLEGEAGNDLLSGGPGDDEILGGSNNDTIYGGQGSDLIDGGTGNNTVFPDRLLADSDNDGDVDGSDFLNWQRNFGVSSGVSVDDGDVNANGIVDGDDLSIWAFAYGASILEPSNVASVLVDQETFDSRELQTASSSIEPLSARLANAAIQFELLSHSNRSDYHNPAKLLEKVFRDEFKPFRKSSIQHFAMATTGLKNIQNTVATDIDLKHAWSGEWADPFAINDELVDQIFAEWDLEVYF